MLDIGRMDVGNFDLNIKFFKRSHVCAVLGNGMCCFGGGLHSLLFWNLFLREDPVLEVDAKFDIILAGAGNANSHGSWSLFDYLRGQATFLYLTLQEVNKLGGNEV